jgi:hypothetical protein
MQTNPKRHLSALACAALFTAMTTAMTTGLAAQTSSLTGRLINSSSTGLSGVTVQLDAGSPSTTTNATGNFTFTGLQNRTYTVSILPAAGSFAPQQFDRAVNGATNLGNVTLLTGALVTGTMLGPTGAPITNGNMNAYDSAGVKLFTPGDATNTLGQFSITVQLGSIRFRTVTPPASSLVPQEEVRTITGATGLGTFHLQRGFTVTGTCVDAVSSAGIGSVRVATTDSIANAAVLQLNPLTSATGAFSLLLPIGCFDLTFSPPTGNAHAGRIRHGLIVIGPQSLGAIQLQPAVFVSGTVLGPAGPVPSTDIDVLTSDGYKLFTPHDNTDAAGNFSVAVPAGTYRVSLQPPVAAGVTGFRTAAQTFNISGSVGTIHLATGAALNLTILGPGGPVADTDIDLLDPVTGESMALTSDHADAAGLIATIAPIGSWNVQLDAPQGSLAAAIRLTNVPIIAPITLTVPMATKTLRLDVVGVGIQQIAQGGQVPINVTLQNTTASTVPATIEVVVRYPSGAETPILPPLPLDVPPLFDFTLSGLMVAIPTVPAGQKDRELHLLVRAHDALTGAQLDEAYAQFVVH